MIDINHSFNYFFIWDIDNRLGIHRFTHIRIRAITFHSKSTVERDNYTESLCLLKFEYLFGKRTRLTLSK